MSVSDEMKEKTPLRNHHQCSENTDDGEEITLDTKIYVIDLDSIR